MNYKDKINQLLKRSSLNNTFIKFYDFNKDGLKYRYPVKITLREFIDGRDKLSTCHCNKKIEKLNNLLENEIKFCKARMREVDSENLIDIYYTSETETTLQVEFKESR